MVDEIHCNVGIQISAKVGNGKLLGMCLARLRQEAGPHDGFPLSLCHFPLPHPKTVCQHDQLPGFVRIPAKIVFGAPRPKAARGDPPEGHCFPSRHFEKEWLPRFLEMHFPVLRDCTRGGIHPTCFARI